MATERTEVLRPAPGQSDVTAAAAVALTLLVAMVNARFDSEWGQGIHLVYTAAAAMVVIGMAAMSPKPVDRPAGWQSVLFVASFVLLFGALSNLADVLGAENPPFGASATVVWVGLLLAGLAAWFAAGWNSGISTLLCALTLVVVILAFIDWVFSPDDVDTFRWILLLIAVGFGGYGAARRPGAPHHAVGYVNAAGVAIFILAATFLAELIASAAFSGDISGDVAQAGWGWELIILTGAGLLIGYSVASRQAGPGYLGVLNLVAYVVLASTPGEDGPSLIGWPLVLIVVTLGLFALARGGGRPGPAGPAAGPPPAGEPVAPPRP